MRKLLLPFSLLYSVGVGLRNWFFDKGILKTSKVPIPVISVGNISVGGVGKTSVVEMLIEKLKSNYQLSVLSRGYGRKSRGTVVVSDGRSRCALVEESGDEPSQFALKFPELIIVVDEKRFRGAQKAIGLGAQLIIMDDGFQHRYLARDLNIAVVSVKELIQGDYLLPAGNRRESMSSLKRANMIIISHCADEAEFDQAAATLMSLDKPMIGVKTELKSIRRVSSNQISTRESFAGKNIVAFSGIGDPVSFEVTLGQTGATMVKHFIFTDHHWYTNSDIEAIITGRKQNKVEFIFTTEKDVVRLKGRFEKFLESEPVYVTEIRQKVIVGEDTLNKLLRNIH